MSPDQVVQKLREIRYAPRLTVSDIIRQAGLSRQTVYDAIHGRASVRTLDAIGQVLDSVSENGSYQNPRVGR